MPLAAAAARWLLSSSSDSLRRSHGGDHIPDLVHRLLAAVARQNLERRGGGSGPPQVDGLLHLRQLGGNERPQGDDPRLLSRVEGQFAQVVELAGNLTHGRVVGFQVVIPPGQEISSLPRLGVLQLREQGFDLRQDLARTNRQAFALCKPRPGPQKEHGLNRQKQDRGAQPQVMRLQLAAGAAACHGRAGREANLLLRLPRRRLRAGGGKEGLAQSAHEKADDYPRQNEQRQGRCRIRIRDGQRVARLQIEPIHRQAADRCSRHARPAPAIAAGHNDGDYEWDVRCLASQYGVERHAHAQRREGRHSGASVAQDHRLVGGDGGFARRRHRNTSLSPHTAPAHYPMSALGTLRRAQNENQQFSTRAPEIGW